MGNTTLLRMLLAEHFAPVSLAQLVVLRAGFPQWMRPDVEQGIRSLVEEGGGPHFFAPRMRGSARSFRFQELFEESGRGATVGVPVFDEVDIGDAQQLACLQRGLWMSKAGGERIAILLEVTEVVRRSSVRVEVAAGQASRKHAEAALASIRAAAERAQTFRGRILAPSEPEYSFDDEGVALRLAHVAPVKRVEIILAPGLLELLERNTIEFSDRCGALRGLGMSVAKGILLHGPPGTGKTLLVRYLVGVMTTHTRFLLSGDRLAFLADTVEAARLLAPSLVVIEDVDLVAAHRDGPFQSTPAALNRLLNDMDGAGREAQILFVLTTNRPEVLEPALAARPGRVDQAIEIGLPDEPERCELLRLYTRRVPVSDDVIRHASGRTGKVSPAFLKELARRGVQAMLARGGGALFAADIDEGLRDMIGARGTVTARLLGAERIGFLAGD